MTSPPTANPTGLCSIASSPPPPESLGSQATSMPCASKTTLQHTQRIDAKGGVHNINNFYTQSTIDKIILVGMWTCEPPHAAKPRRILQSIGGD